MFRVKKIYSCKWALAFENVVRTVGYGPQIDQSQGEYS